MVSGLDPTPLEGCLLQLFHELHGAVGFPSPSAVTVVTRENTGAGRYVRLESSDGHPLSDGHYDMGGKYIELEGVPHGMMAVARVAGGKLVEIEMAVYGGYSWDGIERRWSIS